MEWRQRSPRRSQRSNKGQHWKTDRDADICRSGNAGGKNRHVSDGKQKQTNSKENVGDHKKGQGVGKKKHTPVGLCSFCESECNNGAIKCVTCKLWFHFACQNLSAEQWGLLKESPLPFICQSYTTADDGTYDYSKALSRLDSAKHLGYNMVCETIHREVILMCACLRYLQCMPIESATGLKIDNLSARILEKFGTCPNYTPIATKGEGSWCHFHCLARK